MRLFYWLRIKYKLTKRRFMLINSFCKHCGRDVHDFVADDEIWAKVEPLIKDGYILCYDCFVEKCKDARIQEVWKLS